MTSKSAKTTTMITGSTAVGEALPPHFQFMTAAQTAETQRLRLEMIEWMPSIQGKFGGDENKVYPCTFGMNTKGGMDDEEFHKYIVNSIIPLYPYSQDINGMQVIIKADSGPGRTCKELLAQLRYMGFILFPGVPNTTAVTQETDKNYQPFKTQFRTNLAHAVKARIEKFKSTSLQPFLVGLCVFGGTCPQSKLDIPLSQSAFERGFSQEACRTPCTKVLEQRR